MVNYRSFEIQCIRDAEYNSVDFAVNVMPSHKCFFNFYLIFFFFCLLSFFRASPTAYRGSQARGLIRAVAAGLRHNSQQHRILNPLSEATPQP